MKLLAVDGNNLLMRALHATKRSGMSAHGVPTGPLHVFVTTLAKHVREEEPTHIGIAWDGGGRNLRQGIDESYKANRTAVPDGDHELKESAFALARAFCDLAGLFQVGYPDQGVEADDIIGAWWRWWIRDQARGQMVILSSDKDLLQLVDRPGVRQVRLSSADTETDRWDRIRVAEHYGVPVRLVPALLAIAGDASDNIKGVRGIGPKKAAKALMETLDFEKTITTMWPDQVDELRRNLRMTDIRTAWPHERIPAPAVPPEADLTSPVPPYGAPWLKLKAFLLQYELKTVLERLEAGRLWFGEASPPMAGRPLKIT